MPPSLTIPRLSQGIVMATLVFTLLSQLFAMATPAGRRLDDHRFVKKRTVYFGLQTKARTEFGACHDNACKHETMPNARNLPNSGAKFATLALLRNSVGQASLAGLTKSSFWSAARVVLCEICATATKPQDDYLKR